MRLTIIGRRDRVPATLRDLIEQAEEITRAGTTLHLRIAIDYSSRDEILRAAADVASRRLPFTRDALETLLSTSPPVDLVIRTGAERRLSDFMLWECAYAELFFTDLMWPDFSASHFERAMSDFRGRDRRFGTIRALAAV